MPTTRDLAILIFEGVEVLGFCGPFEVFSVANRCIDPPASNAFTVAEGPGAVLTRGGLSANPFTAWPTPPARSSEGQGVVSSTDPVLPPPAVGLRAVPSAPWVLDDGRQPASGPPTPLVRGR
jgi:hypothetical protein